MLARLYTSPCRMLDQQWQQPTQPLPALGTRQQLQPSQQCCVCTHLAVCMSLLQSAQQRIHAPALANCTSVNTALSQLILHTPESILQHNQSLNQSRIPMLQVRNQMKKQRRAGVWTLESQVVAALLPLRHDM